MFDGISGVMNRQIINNQWRRGEGGGGYIWGGREGRYGRGGRGDMKGMIGREGVTWY